MVPSAKAARRAWRSASLRKGGESFVKVRKSPIAVSESMKCAGVTPAVTVNPRALAARTRAQAARVVIWRKCSRAPVSSANAISRATASASASAGAEGSP